MSVTTITFGPGWFASRALFLEGTGFELQYVVEDGCAQLAVHGCVQSIFAKRKLSDVESYRYLRYEHGAQSDYTAL